MLNIQHIKLLQGSHNNIGTTGQGCFMNVIAYLNGEPQITDKSECVCPTIRPIAIWLNDFLTNGERHILVPFILRVMGTTTADAYVIKSRADKVVVFAEKMAASAADASAAAAAYAADAAHAAIYAATANRAADAAAAYAAAAAAADAAAYAAGAAANYAAARKQIIDAAISFLDSVCPLLDVCVPSPEVINRANELVSLNVEGATCETN